MPILDAGTKVEPANFLLSFSYRYWTHKCKTEPGIQLTGPVYCDMLAKKYALLPGSSNCLIEQTMTRYVFKPAAGRIARYGNFAICIGKTDLTDRNVMILFSLNLSDFARGTCSCTDLSALPDIALI